MTQSFHRPGLCSRIALGVGLTLSLAELARAGEPDAALARIESALAIHPDDPDLAWARARTLARAGRSAEAVEATRRFSTRWPAHRPSARVEVARTLLDQGAPRDADRLLVETLQRDPDSGVAHFYRGLALRADLSLEEADHELQQAARLEPTLLADTLLVRALIQLDLARDEQAISLLQEILRVDPTSDTAVRARLLLREREIAVGRRRLRGEARIGFEWDQNVTLEGAESETRPSDRDDLRGIWGAGISGQPWLSERGSLLLGYRYDQTYHLDLREFDMIQNAVFASLSVLPSEALRDRLALRFDAFGYDTLQDCDHALGGASFRPSLLWSIGPRAGVTRLFGAFEVAEFDGTPISDAWERDSLAVGLGIDQTVPLPQPLQGSWVALSFAWLRTITEAGTSGGDDGFDGDFDADGMRVRALGTVALPWSLRAQIEASYARDQYLNDNSANWFTTGDLRARRDDVIAGRVSFSRPILPFTRLEIYWRGTRRASNVSIYDYDKNLVGLLFHVASSG